MEEKTLEQLQAELAAAQEHIKALDAERNRAEEDAKNERKGREQAEKALKTSGVLKPVTGTYNGYEFDSNHRRIRNRHGAYCDTQMVLDAANSGDAEACALLDWLIKIEYAYFKKAGADSNQAGKSATKPDKKK